jgi:hypothetical protein
MLTGAAGSGKQKIAPQYLKAFYKLGWIFIKMIQLLCTKQI